MTQFFCSADLPMNFEDRVAAVGIATQFQEHINEVFKMVEEETEYAKTQVLSSNDLSCELALQ
jgi:magnesium chelatase subunit D